eukprot:12813530-Alexandrium_andersonii.AAC.2
MPPGQAFSQRRIVCTEWPLLPAPAVRMELPGMSVAGSCIVPGTSAGHWHCLLYTSDAADDM